MSKRLAVLAFAGLLLASGCTLTDRSPQKTSIPGVIESAHVDPETGNLIALWLPRDTGKLDAVLVTCPYAVYIYWPNPEYVPNAAESRVFIFYDNVGKKSYQTRDYSTFLAVVAEQPQGIELLRFETCSMPRCYMPQDEWRRLEQVLAAGNRHWGTNPVEEASTITFCYCETKGEFIYPGNKQ